MDGVVSVAVPEMQELYKKDGKVPDMFFHCPCPMRGIVITVSSARASPGVSSARQK